MKYVSLKLATTDYDPSPSKIIQISMVIEDTVVQGDVKELPHFTANIQQETYSGCAELFTKNKEIISQLANKESRENSEYPIINGENALTTSIAKFLSKHIDFKSGLAVLAGFDADVSRKFLPEHIQKAFLPTSINPMIVHAHFDKDDSLLTRQHLLMCKTDEDLQSMTAYEEALAVISLLRKKY